MEERAFAEIEQEPPDSPLPQRGQRRPWWRNPTVIAAAGVTAVIAALIAGVMIGNSGKHTPAAAFVQTSASIVQSSSAPADAPSTSECTQFADVYNGTVGPALTATSDGNNNVLWTQKADAFQSLADVLKVGADPYSRTLATDAAAIITSDRQYDADGNGFSLVNTFMADLAPFLTQCHMH